MENYEQIEGFDVKAVPLPENSLIAVLKELDDDTNNVEIRIEELSANDALDIAYNIIKSICSDIHLHPLKVIGRMFSLEFDNRISKVNNYDDIGKEIHVAVSILNRLVEEVSLANESKGMVDEIVQSLKEFDELNEQD